MKVTALTKNGQKLPLKDKSWECGGQGGVEYFLSNGEKVGEYEWYSPGVFYPNKGNYTLTEYGRELGIINFQQLVFPNSQTDIGEWQIFAAFPCSASLTTRQPGKEGKKLP